ncbi:MAG: phage holin family protein [Solirubrobacterales bacterium]
MADADPTKPPPRQAPPAAQAPPQASPPEPDSKPREKSVAELAFDVAEGASTLVREEIELAKTEVAEKAGKILRGSAVGIAAGAFAFLALILVMEGVAWLLNEELFDGKTWPGFFIEAAVFLLIAAAAGYGAYRSVQAGSPPVPEQAIEEAKKTKEMLESEAEKTAEGVEKSVVEGSGK